MFDITKYLEETITSLNNSIVSTLLSSPSFDLEGGTVVWWIFMICLVWQLTTIFIDFASNGGFDSKKIINLVVSTIVVFYAYGKFNPRSVSGLDFGLSGTEYDYKGKKTLLRDTHAVFRKFFSDFSDNVTGNNELTQGDVSQTLVDWTLKRSYVENICDGVNDRKSCIEENLKLSIADLKEKHLSDACGTFSSPFCESYETAKALISSPISIGSAVTFILGIIKMVLIVIVFVGYTIITVMSLVMLKIIFPFIILDKTRPAIVTATKFYISTSAFVFVIKIFRFIISSITLGVVQALTNLEYTDSETFVAKSVIGTMLIVAVVVIEVGMLFATPKLTQALFNLQLEVFTRITDELKSSALLIGSIFTGGAVLAGASKVMGTGTVSNIKSKIGGKQSNLSNGLPGVGAGENRFGNKSNLSSGSTGQDSSFKSSSSSNQFDSTRRPFSDSSRQAYDGTKEPDSVVDIEDLSKESSNDESSNNSNQTTSMKQSAKKPDTSVDTSQDAPESVVDKNTNWNSFGPDVNTGTPRKSFKDKNKFNKNNNENKMDFGTEDSDLVRISNDDNTDSNDNNLPSTVSSFDSQDLGSDLTVSSGNSADKLGPEVLDSNESETPTEKSEKSDDVFDAEWREVKDGIKEEDEEGLNNESPKDSKLRKLGSTAIKSAVTSVRVTTNVLRGLTRLTSAAVDAGKGSTGGVDNFRDEVLAIPNIGKRRVMANRILNDAESNLSEKDRIILTDFLDIHKGQRPEHKKRAESIIENYESDLAVRRK